MDFSRGQRRKEIRAEKKRMKERERQKKQEANSSKNTKSIRRVSNGWVIKNKVRLSYSAIACLGVISLLVAFFIGGVILGEGEGVFIPKAFGDRGEVTVIKNKIIDLKKQIKDVEAKIGELDVNLPAKESLPERLRSQIKSVNKTSTDGYNKWLDLNKEYNKAVADYRAAVKESVFLRHELTRLLKNLEQFLKDEVEAIIALKPKQSEFIGIYRSASCLVPPVCIDNKFLVTSFDNSNWKYSGKFVMVDGDYKREDPKYKSHWEIYKYSKKNVTVAVDPDAQWSQMKKMAIIIIEPTGFVFNLPKELANRDLVYNSNAYISRDCMLARVTPDKTLIKDVVLFIYGGCSGPSPLVTNITKLKSTEYSPKDSPAYAEILKWENAKKCAKTKNCK